MEQDHSNICAFMYHAFWKHYIDFEVSINQFTQADQAIKGFHNPRTFQESESRPAVDYNNPAYRCVYLHRYASIHASAIWLILLNNREILMNLISNDGNDINICCVGGGPGTDIVGICAALCSVQESSGKTFRFTTVDSMRGWRYVLQDIKTIAGMMNNASLGQFLSRHVGISCINSDLHSFTEDIIIEAIRGADMLTMVKFISIVDQRVVVAMLQNIFQLMKPGAFVLFIDNSGGGYLEKMEQAAFSCGLEVIGSHWNEYEYRNEIFDHTLFGVTSLSTLRVAMKIWKKPNHQDFHPM